MSLLSAVTWRRQTITDATAADVIRYGPDIATEAELRLLGHVSDKRVLELGCGSGASSVAMARQGARATGLDFSPQHLSASSHARHYSTRFGVTPTWVMGARLTSISGRCAKKWRQSPVYLTTFKPFGA